MTQAIEELSVNIQMKCFEKCVSKPSGKLDSKQQNCVALCVNRYIDTLNVVSQTMVGTQVQRCIVYLRISILIHVLELSDGRINLALGINCIRILMHIT